MVKVNERVSRPSAEDWQRVRDAMNAGPVPWSPTPAGRFAQHLHYIRAYGSNPYDETDDYTRERHWAFWRREKEPSLRSYSPNVRASISAVADYALAVRGGQRNEYDDEKLPEPGRLVEPPAESSAPRDPAADLYALTGKEAGEDKQVDQLVATALDPSLAFEARKRAVEKLERKGENRQMRDDKATVRTTSEDTLDWFALQGGVADRQNRAKLFGPSFDQRSGGKIRRGKQKRSGFAIATTTKDGKRWSDLGADEAAIRDFLADKTEDLVALCEPFGRGRQTAAEHTRYDELAGLVAEARRAGALVKAIGNVIGRDKKSVLRLAERGRELANVGAA
jgi:hypothetical protein